MATTNVENKISDIHLFQNTIELSLGHTQPYTHTHVYMHVCVCMYVRVYMCVYMYVYIYLYTYIYLHTYIYIYRERERELVCLGCHNKILQTA